MRLIVIFIWGWSPNGFVKGRAVCRKICGASIEIETGRFTPDKNIEHRVYYKPQAVEYDLDLASPRLLGRDVGQLASAATLEQLHVLLNNAKMTDRLITHMSAVFRGANSSIAAAERLLAQFRAGLNIKGALTEPANFVLSPRS